MAEPRHVDWDGLVYYDGKIKQYIEDKLDSCVKMGGSTHFADLPSPSFQNLNYIYKITEEFTSDECFDTPGYVYQPDTWVMVSDLDGVYLYTIFCEPAELAAGTGSVDTSKFVTNEQLEALLGEKANEVPFTTDMIVGNALGGFAVGDSLKGMTIAGILTKLLGLTKNVVPETVVDTIIENKLFPYTGSENGGTSAVEWKQLDGSTAAHTDEGFYQIVNTSGDVSESGYQMTFSGNTDMDAQIFAVPTEAKIVKAYYYDFGGSNTWLATEFPGMQWVEGDVVTKEIDGITYPYNEYLYNVEEMGDAMVSNEYWRFALEEKK